MSRVSAGMGCARPVRSLVLRAFAFAMVAGLASVPYASPGDTLDLPSASARGARAAGQADGTHHLDGEALRRFATLEDALASLPGFRVRRAGGLGGYSELSFRGARATAVEVYVDGVRLNQDGDGAPDLAKWPALWFSSLTARTGLEAGSADPGTLARIDLSTRSGRRAEVHARGGSFGTGEAAVQATHGPAFAPGWHLTASLQGQAARNDYTVDSDNGTLHNAADDRTWKMDNNAYASRGARAAARRDHASGSQEFSLLWLNSRKEYPGRFPSTARAHTLRTDWLAAWRMTRTLSAWSVRDAGASWGLGAQVRRLEDAYRDPARTLGPFSFEQARVSTAAELSATLDMPLAAAPDGRAGTWVAQVETRLRAEDIDPVRTPFTQQMESPAATRSEAGAGVRLTARRVPGLPSLMTFTAEARPAYIRFQADGVRSFPSGPLSAPTSEVFTPVALRAAAGWPTRAGTWSLVARREPRAPSSGELLGDNNGIHHNPGLRAEATRSISAVHALAFGAGAGEGAADTRAWSARLQTAVYANRYDDPIRLTARGTSPFLRHENAEGYRAVGVEWSAHAFTRRLDAAVSLTAQDAVILAGAYEGKRPAYVSEADAHAEAFLKPASGVRLGTMLDFRSPYYPGDANVPVSRRGAEWEWGAHAGYVYGPVRIALDARNLLDRRYHDFAYSPRSGRAWALTLSVAL
ncbi:MAG TPA: TonB-dependent receptor plug domain-containing protein [Fibrobacteria bacterium]|nr:TonB-dependent receptor plug domain-containing protein [Fibrobacteria bacterium]